MNKMSNFLLKLSDYLSKLAYFFKENDFKNKYYVYVPSNCKPRFIHNSFKSAREEALRLKKQFEENAEYYNTNIQILQIVEEIEPDFSVSKDEIPF